MITINPASITDTFNFDRNIIVHACNCFHTMGTGAAKALRDKWPGVYEVDKLFKPKGDKTKLGDISVHVINSLNPHNLQAVINAYTQYRYGRDRRYTDYEAVYSCLEKIKARVERYEGTHSTTLSIAMTPLGCSNAGGSWRVVKAMIEDVFGPNRDILILTNGSKNIT